MVKRSLVSSIASSPPALSKRRFFRGENPSGMIVASNARMTFLTFLFRSSLFRQSHKQSLSSCVVDEAQDAERHFSGEDLRALFLYKEDTISDTHDTYKCKRCKDGKQWIKSPAMLYGDTST